MAPSDRWGPPLGTGRSWSAAVCNTPEGLCSGTNVCCSLAGRSARGSRSRSPRGLLGLALASGGQPAPPRSLGPATPGATVPPWSSRKAEMLFHLGFYSLNADISSTEVPLTSVSKRGWHYPFLQALSPELVCRSKHSGAHPLQPMLQTVFPKKSLFFAVFII